MPSTESPRRGAFIALVALALTALLGACDTSATPSATAVASTAPRPCTTDEIAASGINGSVVDSDGNPLGDIFVQIETGDGFRGTTRTGTDGAFTAPGVSGDFVITTVDIAYASVTQRVTVPCGETIDVELVLTPTDG
jgi:hypothetical protein